MNNFLGRELNHWLSWFFMVFMIFLIAFLMAGCSAALAAEIPEEKAVHAILGEASPGASYEELSAFAHALRNRGTLHGVYGYLADPSGAQWQRGSRAWVESESTPDVTLGAGWWLSSYDLKHSRPALIAWRHKMVETVVINGTHFYRRK